MTTETPDMWTYWRDKRGYEDALKLDFPETLKNNLQLQTALYQIECNKKFIDTIMKDLEGQYYEENDE